jgi:hypothetical protein
LDLVLCRAIEGAPGRVLARLVYWATGRRANNWIKRPGLALLTTGEAIGLSALAHPVKRFVLYW